MGVSIGFSKQKSKSFVDPKQAPFLDFLRNTGKTQLERTGGRASDWAEYQGRNLFDFGQQSLGSLQNNPFLDSLQAQSGGNPEVLAAMTQQLGADIGQQFNERVLPGIRRDSTAIGALGGSRQGIAEGVAGRGAMDAFSRGASGLAYDWATADADRALRAAETGGQLFGQGGEAAAHGASDLFNLGMGQFTGGFAPIQAYADILGPPSVLNKSRGFSYKGSYSQFPSQGGGGT